MGDKRGDIKVCLGATRLLTTWGKYFFINNNANHKSYSKSNITNSIIYIFEVYPNDILTS
jgi:hypothetical protein